MLALGRTVTFKGQSGLVVARTFEKCPRYDLRMAEGNVVKNVVENEIEEVLGWGIDPKRIVGTLAVNAVAN